MRGSHEAGNPDGWGVAYFEGLDATLLREAVPAAESPMVQFLNHNAPLSEMIVSHVRRATCGDRKLVNTQPFRRVLGGHTHIFAHNGHVPISRMPETSSWLMPQGDTDSELLFCQLLGRLEPLWRNGTIPALADRFDVISCFACEILQLGAANFLYSDGVNLFAHGHRHTLPGEAISTDPGLYLNMFKVESESGMTDHWQGLHSEGRFSQQALVTTLPLNDNTWVPLKAGEIACFEHGERIR